VVVVIASGNATAGVTVSRVVAMAFATGAPTVVVSAVDVSATGATTAVSGAVVPATGVTASTVATAFATGAPTAVSGAVASVTGIDGTSGIIDEALPELAVVIAAEDGLVDATTLAVGASASATDGLGTATLGRGVDGSMAIVDAPGDDGAGSPGVWAELMAVTEGGAMATGTGALADIELGGWVAEPAGGVVDGTEGILIVGVIGVDTTPPGLPPVLLVDPTPVDGLALDVGMVWPRMLVAAEADVVRRSAIRKPSPHTRSAKAA
jgi:hypothetical protein